MRVAYIAGPYRAASPYKILTNIRRAAQVALRYWKLGYAVICPHMNTCLFDGEAQDSVWLEGDLELIRRCDVVVAMDTWQQSIGAKAEIALAESLGLEVIYDGQLTPAPPEAVSGPDGCI